MMRQFYRSVAFGVTAVLLSACGATFDTVALRQQHSDAQTFSAELGRAYKDFALYEIDEMVDWIDGTHFGEKAQLAFAQKIPEPENVENWWLTKEQKPIFETARKRLIHRLDKHARNQMPKVAASAQVNFDCWIEQQEENWQVADIEKCREGFFAAIDRLDEVAELARSNYLPQSAQSISAVSPQETSSRQTLFSPRSANEKRTYTLYFKFDKSEMVEGADDQLDRVLQDYRAGSPVTILLAGHTDRAGRKPYNLNLSRLRAEAVRQKLLKRGVPVQMIEAQAFGENVPRKTTVDGMKEPLNRRVEITLGPASAF